jgi:hypothetical protein
MSQKQFSILIGAGIFCALLFATPGLFRLYEDISDTGDTPVPPFEFLTKRLSWGENEVDVEFTLVLTREGPPEQLKTHSKGAMKVFVAAEITNTKEKPIEVQSLDFVLACGKVDLLTQSFMSSYSAKAITLKPREIQKLQTVVYITKDTLNGLMTGEVSISARGAFPEAL